MLQPKPSRQGTPAAKPRQGRGMAADGPRGGRGWAADRLREGRGMADDRPRQAPLAAIRELGLSRVQADAVREIMSQTDSMTAARDRIIDEVLTSEQRRKLQSMRRDRDDRSGRGGRLLYEGRRPRRGGWDR